MTQERLIGKNKVQVVLVESFDHKVNDTTDKVITTLPARFRANGLPYLIEFELNKNAEITNLKMNCASGIKNKTKVPFDRLRSLAIIEATHIVPCFDKLQGASLYQRIGQIYDNTIHGSKHALIAQHFGLSIAWAHKHTAIGKQNYPKYFKSCNKTKQKRRMK
jgi:hypothetical protein